LHHPARILGAMSSSPPEQQPTATRKRPRTAAIDHATPSHSSGIDEGNDDFPNTTQQITSNNIVHIDDDTDDDVEILLTIQPPRCEPSICFRPVSRSPLQLPVAQQLSISEPWMERHDALDDTAPNVDDDSRPVDIFTAVSLPHSEAITNHAMEFESDIHPTDISDDVAVGDQAKRYSLRTSDDGVWLMAIVV
jgi:hypothetical protein